MRGATIEKTLLLGPCRWNFLGNGTFSRASVPDFSRQADYSGGSGHELAKL